METTTARFKIYVICLNSYDHGKQHGRWIDVLQDENEIQKEIEQMLSESQFQPAKDYRIYASEGFEKIKVQDFSEIKDIKEVAEIIKKYGEPIKLYIDNMKLNDVDNSIVDEFLGTYKGEYNSRIEFVAELLHDPDEIQQSLKSYIDYEKLANDLFINDYYSIKSSCGKICVFDRI